MIHTTKIIEYSLYFIYNNINGKIYVGITKNIKKRWSQHKRAALSTVKDNKFPIHNAIAKHKHINFIFKQVDIFYDLNSVYKAEKEYIKFLKENGYILYNVTVGGSISYTTNNNLTARERMSNRMTGSNNTMYGVRVVGEANCNAKFTNNQADEIRSLYNSGNTSYSELASIYNTTKTCISNIIHYKTYNINGTSKIPTKSKNIITKSKVKELVDMVNVKNLSNREIMNILNISETSFYRILKNLSKGVSL